MTTKKTIKKNRQEQLGEKIMEMMIKHTEEYLVLFDPNEITPKRLINLALSGPAIFSYNTIRCLMDIFTIKDETTNKENKEELQEILIKQTILQLTRAFGMKQLSLIEIDRMYDQVIAEWAEEVAKIEP